MPYYILRRPNQYVLQGTFVTREGAERHAIAMAYGQAHTPFTVWHGHPCAPDSTECDTFEYNPRHVDTYA